VNLGGDPERDDFGLPPVDIEIPDDARELDRDVQAYRRELRAQRRRLRARRLHGPLTRNGMVLPLLAGCLVLALISGTLLTLFSAGQANLPGLPGRATAGPATTGSPAGGRAAGGTTGAGRQPASQPSASGTGASAATGPSAGPGSAGAAIGEVGGQLPDQTVVVAGQSMPLRSLPPAVLALIPAGCQCTVALRQLARQAAAARVALYLVGTVRAGRQLKRLATLAGQRSARVAVDVHNVLGPTYKPAGLTAILVRSNGTVARVASRLQPGLALTSELTRL
jgi:hypothetical protein